MTIRFQRNTYCPIHLFQKNGRSPVITTLDWLSASYNTLFEDVKSFRYYTITEEEAGLPDALAKRFYDTEELWWLICVYNGIVDPFTEFVAGLRIKIPNLQQSTLSLYRNNRLIQASEIGRVTEVD